MSRRALDKRLDRTGVAIEQQPLSVDAIDGHYRQFLTVGDLPDNRRAAWAVLKRALCARRAGQISYQVARGRLAGPPREQLFREAAHPFEPARLAARLVIRALVGAGEDPSDPEFVPADSGNPEFGTVGLHLLGWPDAWVAPERAAQMRRVMEQHAHLRAGVLRDDAWFRAVAAAVSAFLRRGELPKREDLLQSVLTAGEMLALHTHHFRRVGDELLDAFEAAASATVQARENALQRLGEIQARHTAEGHHAHP